MKIKNKADKSSVALISPRKKKLSTRTIQLYILCVIPMIFIFIFNYLPMGGIIIAFKNYSYSKGIFGSPWVGFKNFEFFFSSKEFLRITWNTLSMNFLFITIGRFTAIFVAIMLFELVSRAATKVYQTIMILPHFFSWVIVSYLVYAFLNPQSGFINSMLEKMGFGGIEWYSKPNLWPAILVIVHIWKGIGMGSVVYYAALMGMDMSCVEAAKIDGASKFKVYWHVIIPSLVPMIVMLIILDIGKIFHADFGLFYQVTRNVGLLYETTDVIDTYVFRTMRVLGDMGMSTAVGLLQSCVGFILVMLTNYASKKFDENCALF